MNLENLSAVMGKPITDYDLHQALRREGIELDPFPVLPQGQFNAYCEMQESGVAIIFTDEAMFEGKGDQPIGVGPLIFTGAFLYSEGKDGYRQYEGVLPKGLQFTDARADVVRKLGRPSWQRARSDGSIAAERWDDEAKRLHITYKRSDTTISVVSVFVPGKPL
jgi:hypothetical protein